MAFLAPVYIQAKIVSTLFAAQRDFIVLASQCAKPAADKLQPLLGPMVTHLTAVSDIKDANRRSPQFNHLSAVSEGIPAAGWVALVSVMFSTYALSNHPSEVTDERRDGGTSVLRV